MFKLGILLIIFGSLCSAFLPPMFSGWEKRDWLSTFPFVSGILLCILSVFVYFWRVLP